MTRRRRGPAGEDGDREMSFDGDKISVTAAHDYRTFRRLRDLAADRAADLEVELAGRRDPEAMRRRDELYVGRAIVRKYDPEIRRLRRRQVREAA